ncbi:MAG: hypothetical protein ACX93O_09975 [Flagellimonas sp.]
MRNIVNTGEVVQTVGELGDAVGDLLEELFSQKEELLNQLAEAESFEEQQGFISQINDLEVTIDQQIDQIPNKENLPQELQDELQELKQEGSIVANNVLTPQEIADISTADTERRERIREIAAIAEEEIFYDSKEYISKVFQKIRCAYANGSSTLSSDYFDKVGQEFTAIFDDYGRITLKLISKETHLGNISHTTVEASSGSGNKTDNHTLYTLDYGGATITAKSYGEQSNTANKFEKLQNYLFPNDPNAIKQEAETLLGQILAKNNLADEDIRGLKAIANCGAMYFTVDDKYRIIQKIAAGRSYITEYYEDLILDLIENHSGDITTYSKDFLEKLEGDPQLLEILFKEMDDITFWKGNEDNFTRFLQVIYGLWQGSIYSNAETYTYVEELADDGYLSPYILTYDGESWFPDIEYESTVFTDTGVEIATRTFMGKHGTMAYKYFQPIWIVFAANGEGQVTKTQVPAIYFAGTAKKDNLKKSLDQIGLTMDVALTLSAIGNFTKLRHLTRLQQVGNIVLGTVEVTSAAADILVRYTELCEGNEDFCEAFQEYNTYLQLGLLGSGLLRAKFNSARKSAEEEYIKHREALVNKYGADDARIKELDTHFGVVNSEGILSTLIDNKIKVLPKESLYGNQALTFLNEKYIIGETLEDVITYRRFGGNAKLRGVYVSTLEKLSREELALVKEFNNSMRFEAVIKIPKGEKLAIGKVGPWPPKAPEFMGGADQIIINKFDYPEYIWVEKVKDLKTGTIYSYGDFCQKFKNLCQQ